MESIKKILQGVAAKTIGIEWTSNIALGSVKDAYKAAFDFNYLINHLIKYTIRDFTNAIGNYYWSLDKYECDKDIGSKECSTQIVIGSAAALLATPTKAMYLAKNSNGRISYFEAVLIVFLEQILYEVTGKFKNSETTIGTLVTVVPIETSVALMSGDSIAEGIFIGVVVSFNVLNPYSFIEEMLNNNADQVNILEPICLPYEEHIMYGLNSSAVNQCFDIG